VAYEKRRQDLRDLKMTEEQIVTMLGEEDEEPGGEFLVMPENWESVLVFCSLGSRWKGDGMSGIFYGLERGDIVSTLELMQIAPCRYPHIFADVQVMEAEALKIFNSK